MSVQSVTFGFAEVCQRSHEFLRRGCSNTPVEISWAGDLVVVKESILKQSEVNDMRGGEAEVEYTYHQPNCGDITVGLPSQYKVESTAIRTGGENSFGYTVPKAENPEDEKEWDLGIYQTLNDCGVLHDGGDALQTPNSTREVISLCGTLRRNAGLSEPQAHFLDNRDSFSKDPDNGLLIAIRTGFVWNWEVRYATKENILTEGLMKTDDVTVAFAAAIGELGMTNEDVFYFGML